MPDSSLCHSCEKAPIRACGEYVTKVEAWSDQRLYCEACAAEWLREDEPASDEDRDV